MNQHGFYKMEIKQYETAGVASLYFYYSFGTTVNTIVPPERFYHNIEEVTTLGKF